MAQIIPHDNEDIESILYRFKRQVSIAGIFQDIRKKRHFETPREKYIRKNRIRKKRKNKF